MKRSILVLLSAMSCMVATARTSLMGPADLDEFHKKIAANGGNSAIDPAIVRSSNKLLSEYGAIVNAAKWDTTSIPVCWENQTSAPANEIAWVKDSIEKTWQSESALKFTNWGNCPKTAFAGIRIYANDEGPHTNGLGKLLPRTSPGMVLNFAFHNWSPVCATPNEHENCVRSIAVHEFGHAIGFTHEQNRPDAPGECRKESQGNDPDKLLTPYDEDSVMNYCNKRWNNDGFLSKLDIDAVRTLYGAPGVAP